jgi:cephalosporin hydroxylase
MITKIEEVLEYVEYLKTAPPYEINEHLATFQRLGAECKTIAEFGVGIGTSTWAFLSTNPTRMRSYDIIEFPQINSIKETATAMEWDWQLTIQDTTVPGFHIEPCDLLFIDALHTGEAVEAELRQNHQYVGKYIIFHDIEKYGEHGQDERGEVTPGIRGINGAINEFLTAHPEWLEVERYKNNNGLLVIKKVSE